MIAATKNVRQRKGYIEADVRIGDPMAGIIVTVKVWERDPRLIEAWAEVRAALAAAAVSKVEEATNWAPS